MEIIVLEFGQDVVSIITQTDDRQLDVAFDTKPSTSFASLDMQSVASEAAIQRPSLRRRLQHCLRVLLDDDRLMLTVRQTVTHTQSAVSDRHVNEQRRQQLDFAGAVQFIVEIDSAADGTCMLAKRTSQTCYYWYRPVSHYKNASPRKVSRRPTICR